MRYVVYFQNHNLNNEMNEITQQFYIKDKMNRRCFALFLMEIVSSLKK